MSTETPVKRLTRAEAQRRLIEHAQKHGITLPAEMNPAFNSTLDGTSDEFAENEGASIAVEQKDELASLMDAAFVDEPNEVVENNEEKARMEEDEAKNKAAQERIEAREKAAANISESLKTPTTVETAASTNNPPESDVAITSTETATRTSVPQNTSTMDAAAVTSPKTTKKG